MAAPVQPSQLRFDEFPPATHTDWQAAAEALLPDAASLESLATETYEGLRLQPLYDAEHCADLRFQRPLPHTAPGTGKAAPQPRPWEIVQASDKGDPHDANRDLAEGVKQGATAIEITPDMATLLCQPGVAASSASGGPGGTSLTSATDCATLLQDIALERTPLLLHCGARSLPLPALLLAGLSEHDVDYGALRGSLGADPLGWLAATGSLPASAEALYDEQALWLAWCIQHLPGLNAIFLDGCVWHEAGANAVQELACSLANATATLRAMHARGLAIDDVAPRLSLSLAIGSDLLMELAKLRAARLLWSQVTEAFGASPEARGLTLHAKTGRRNKSGLDPWSNMLRSTFEALIAIIGGCDSLRVDPHDTSNGKADDRARRLARNQQLILKHEAGLDRLQDPAGGSWTLEVLTDWLAREAWRAFQDIEAQGGLLAALQAGSIQRDICAVAQRRTRRHARRQDILTGSNRYAAGNEFTPQASVMTPGKAQATRLPHETAPALATPALRTRGLGQFDILLDAAQDGASLTQLANALPGNQTRATTVTALRSQRLASPWETLRAAASEHRRKGGQSARVYLALCGDAARLHARASFVSDFFQAGGFECIDGAVQEQPEVAAKDACASAASLVVLCARDAEYAALAGPFCQRIRAECPDTLVYIAGRPEPGAEPALREAGIDDFVHLASDCLAMNQALQRHAGITA